MTQPKRADEKGFRALLVLGAIVSVAVGIWGLLWTGMLENVFGFDVPNRVTAFAGVGRLYGAAMLAIGVGYALAAAQPHRNRSLLVPLFVVPVATAVALIAAVARDEVSTGRGVVFIVYNLAFAMLYFRLYPRVPEVGSGGDQRSEAEPPSAGGRPPG